MTLPISAETPQPIAVAVTRTPHGRQLRACIRFRGALTREGEGRGQ
jgi:hypothetical protein